MQIRRPGVVAAGAFAAMGMMTGAHAGIATSNNHVNIVIERIADDITPSANFFLLVDVALPDETGVTGVILGTPGGAIPLEDEDGDGSLWTGEPDYASFNDVKTALNGTWTIDIVGTTPSTTTFTVDMNSMVDGDLYPTPTMIAPTSGATGVAADTLISWTAPAGSASAEYLFLEVVDQSDSVEQEANNIDGTLSLVDTSWNPPLDLADGENELALAYYETDDTRVSGYTVTGGSIAWGSSPFAPAGYTANDPLLALGSETIIIFNVGAVVCTGDIDGNGAVGFSDVLAVIGAWGPCDGPCNADLDEDGVVGFGDILTLFGSWGPCP